MHNRDLVEMMLKLEKKNKGDSRKDYIKVGITLDALAELRL